MKKRHEQKLIILSFGLMILFSAPIVLLFNSERAVFGLPMLYVYIFGVWLLSVVASFIIFKKYDE
ncbi:hypothetical protein NG800_015720 [Epilithonimonas ginsengisoli]|uniref:DUF3311 domain-containing protein n=1 Tax=Epilithonimonas ginsengisoli TaxID=1245592 RepID=A0ABU4JL23_9FLAO|nr:MULTISPECIES: hypothetical protein [Chryseobacterium group]MBV6881407.1 hypothetical protein [Epilithonimonas sp. FP105]MDW8550375.1 hypothetical protein [Epilithonimonas ginsengisoli]OAH74211.1 hypothetical protein AXA65_06735 [Chryseobacterium sp. FP211-J200]